MTLLERKNLDCASEPTEKYYYAKKMIGTEVFANAIKINYCEA